MGLTKKQKRTIYKGNWMIRRDDNGTSFNKFQWKPIGEWTEAPDWDEIKECGNGLHGQGPEASGFHNSGKTVVFCITEGKRIVIFGDKVKVRRAMRLFENDLSNCPPLNFQKTLDLSNCTSLTHLPDKLKVCGNLYLENCTKLKKLPDNLTVGRSLYLYGCKNLKTLSNNLTVGQDLDLCGCINLIKLPANMKVGKDLYLKDCINLTSLPDNLKVRGEIYK